MSRLLLLLLAIATPIVQMQIDGQLGAGRSQHEILYLWSGEHVKRLAPGLEGVAADIYWLRTVQYFGGQRAFGGGMRFELLKPLIEITVTLDPRMEMAYRYGAIFLAEPTPVGAGQPEDAVALLERGVRALPDKWTLRQDLGFYRFLFLGQPREAANILTEAAELPGAPAWLKNLAADVLAKSGDRETARRMWRRIAEQFEGQMRMNALTQIEVLDAADEADRLSEIVAAYARRAGRRPLVLDELHAAALIRRPALDAKGIPFDYDAETGIVTVSRRSPLWRKLS